MDDYAKAIYKTSGKFTMLKMVTSAEFLNNYVEVATKFFMDENETDNDFKLCGEMAQYWNQSATLDYSLEQVKCQFQADQHSTFNNVLFALYEKGIEFTSYAVDVINGENYSSWFLELNPKGEVPILQNGLLIIPESSQILNYIENNYSSNNYKNLIPKLKNHNDKVVKRVIFLSKIINRVPVGAISMGSFMHSEICEKPKPPFIGPIRDQFLKSDQSLSNMLRYYAEHNPSHQEMLHQKAEFHDKKRKIIMNPDEFYKIIKNVELIFDEIEKELESHLENNRDWWLCCEEFTLADVSLGILLHRFNQLGLENYFWGKNKKPCIAKYYLKIQQRETFIKSLPSSLEVWKTVWQKSPVSYKLGMGLLSFSSLVLAGSFALKRFD